MSPDTLQQHARFSHMETNIDSSEWDQKTKMWRYLKQLNLNQDLSMVGQLFKMDHHSENNFHSQNPNSILSYIYRISPDTSFYPANSTKLIKVWLPLFLWCKRKTFWFTRAYLQCIECIRLPIKAAEETQALWSRQTFWLHLAFKPLFQSEFTDAGFHFALEMLSKTSLGKYQQQNKTPTTYTLQKCNP